MTPGDLYYIKSSEEPVVVLACDLVDNPMYKVSVRRPVSGQNGTQYEVFDFYRFELETAEEQDFRKIADLKRRHIMTQQAAKEVPQDEMLRPADPNALRN